MDGVSHRGGAGRQVELAENIADVTIDGAFAQAQLVGDLFVRTPARNQA
jgi:hypothetical protein